MKISDKINSKTVVLPLQSNCKYDTLQELLNHCKSLDYLTSTVKLISSLDEKEKKMSSASGRGVAYHYNTSIEVDDMIAVLGISKKGINYDAADGMLCNFILLILEPESKEQQHRQFINYFQDMINDISIKEQLLDADTKSEIEQIIINWENQISIDNEFS
tara:strand:+ start:868 stop:1350 length:483 start_codon:yes stop_codon:yes gene_type:complete